MNAAALMTEHPVTVSPHTPLADARDLLLHRDFRHIPVVDGDGLLVGIISDRDLLRIEGAMTPGHTVARIMTSDVITAGRGDSLEHLIDLLVDRDVSAVPVVEADGRLVGIVSWVDILLAVRRR